MVWVKGDLALIHGNLCNVVDAYGDVVCFTRRYAPALIFGGTMVHYTVDANDPGLTRVVLQ